MHRWNQRPLSLTTWQLQQLKPIGLRLRKLNRAARRELRGIRYTDLSPTQYREAGNFFGTIATRMIGALRSYKEISKAEQEPLDLRLNVHFVTPCVHNTNSMELTARDADEVEGKVLEQDSAHQVEIESLLQLTDSTEELVSRRSMLRVATPHAIFRGTNRFRLAVLQQRQQLLATSPQPKLMFELEVADGPDICTECLKSKEIDGTMESHDQQF
jgi:hypothetical protein